MVTLPLARIRVLDLVEGPLAGISRLFADLGADVRRLERASREPVDHAMQTLAADIASLGKQVELLDLASADGKAAFDRELSHADLVVVGGDPLVLERVRAEATRRPGLVVLVATMFGADNDWSTWQATDPVLHALSASLSRSGIRGREPLIPPGAIALHSAIAHGAYAALAALYEALTSGRGEWIDYAAVEGAVQALDPGFGSSGVAATGRTADKLSPQRPSLGFRYPIYRCADGEVRICLLSPRQWQGMFRWMGEPLEFADPAFNTTAKRYQSPELSDALAQFFGSRHTAELEASAAEFGVPLAIMRRFEGCVASDHVRARHALTRVELSSGRSALIPNGVIEIDGVRCGPRGRDKVAPSRPTLTARAPSPTLSRLKVLDLGVIVVGAEQSRLLADLGADVVKIETAAFPDGSRQAGSGGMSASFAAGHRNKRSLGLNLRHPEGQALFLRLAAKADVVFSNFKPGTLEGLGIDRAVLAKLNPQIITVESSAFGATGPWSARLGYGPLVRAAAGVSKAWRYADDPGSYSDSVTVYPDHVAGRVGAIAALALLIRRLDDGEGGEAKISQMEVMLDHFAADIASSDLEPGGVRATDAPWGVYRAAGDDEWCVVTVRGDADWLRLAPIIGCEGPRYLSAQRRLEGQAEIDAAVSVWMASRSAQEAMETLQAAGVPAARMLRVADLPSFAYFQTRRFFVSERHPAIEQDLVAERGPFRGQRLGAAPQRPAPLMGQHTAEVMRDWLGTSEAEIGELVRKGVLEPAAAHRAPAR